VLVLHVVYKEFAASRFINMALVPEYMHTNCGLMLLFHDSEAFLLGMVITGAILQAASSPCA